MTANRNVKHADVASFFCNKYKELTFILTEQVFPKYLKIKING